MQCDSFYFLRKCGIFYVSCHILCELLTFMFVFLCVELFLVFPYYPSDVSGVCSDSLFHS